MLQLKEMKQYICAVCANIMKNPHCLIVCGHRYCYDCIINLKRENTKFQCLICQRENEDTITDFSVDKWFVRDLGFQREINELMVTCPNANCWQQIKYVDLENHLPTCNYRTNQCSKCLSNFQFLDSNAHQKICNGGIKCNLCNEIVNAEYKKSHDDKECRYANSVCPCCSSIVHNDKLQEHVINNCPITWITQFADNMTTPYACPYGCLLSDDASAEKENLDYAESINLYSDILQHAKSTNIIATHLDRLYACMSERGLSIQLNKEDPCQEVETTFLHSCRLLQNDLNELHSTITKELETLADTTKELNEEDMKRKLMKIKLLRDKQDFQIYCLNMELTSMECNGYDGTIIWQIKDIANERQKAIEGVKCSIYSPFFYTSHYGYKMCARIYLNGDGIGQNTHIGLYFVIAAGEYDDILRWPFQQKVSFVLLDQSFKMDIISSFIPDTTSTSFCKPTKHFNVASGCPQFIKLQDVFGSNRNDSYVVDDTMFVKVIVDVSDL